jgi:beta-galactosidase
MTFTNTITNPHLWNGKADPHLYNITLEISKDNVLYHRFTRPYGLRFYEYVINDITKVGTSANPYTGFLLNGSPYLLRGCCMHDDIEGRANALTETDYNNTFNTIQELGLNFLRLAHYPHPKEVYDRCDQLGIVVQTEGPCVNKLQSTMPTDYYDHLNIQYTDMVNQHYNHPCIFFWGLSNETTTDDKAFGKTKVEGYTTFIKNLDPSRLVGYVLAQSPGTSPSAYYNDPSNIDWFGCNIYVGWYDTPNSNTPTSQINTRLNNTINRVGKPMAYSEYGCGGTQHCHSEDPLTTTTRGNHERHDIEYMMWLHEGQIATIKQYPQLLFTSQWQLFDIAVANRNEGYTVCLDGETTSIDDELRRLNNKGLVERDHITKKDPFYLYKAWWNPTPFVHICGKDYTKKTDRVIKCYSNDGPTLTLYVGTVVNETTTWSQGITATLTDNIAEFTQQSFNTGDIIKVVGTSGSED